MKKKKKTIAQMVEKAAEALQLYVRVEAADMLGNVSCVTCGKRSHYKDGMQGGHFIGRKWVATKLLETNVHPQCVYCNKYLSGNYIPYTLFMQDKYGRDYVDNLEVRKNEVKKYTRDEVEEITRYFKDEIARIQKEKGI